MATASNRLRQRKHILEGRSLGVATISAEEEEAGRTPLHAAVRQYLEIAERLKKPNTLRRYKAVLDRFLDFFPDKAKAQDISTDDLDQFMVFLKKKHRLGNNSIIHNLIIVAQFLKKQGRPGLTPQINLPERSRVLPQEYMDQELKAFFSACTDAEHTLFLTFLLTGFREQEVVHLWRDDIHLPLQTIRVTAKPELGFSPKRCEEREVPKDSLFKVEDRPRTTIVIIICFAIGLSPTGERRSAPAEQNTIGAYSVCESLDRP